MKMTRKEFLALSGGAGVGAALFRAFPSLAQDITASASVKKIVFTYAAFPEASQKS